MDETTKPTGLPANVQVAPRTEGQPDDVENMVVETYEPKKSCRKCHGRGIIGYIEGDVKQPYYCTCLIKVKKTLPVKMVKQATPAETVIVQDGSKMSTGVQGTQGVGPCPQGVPGTPGVVNDSQVSV